MTAGKVAYQKWQKLHEGLAGTWDNLTPYTRSVWESVAKAVIEYSSTPKAPTGSTKEA